MHTQYNSAISVMAAIPHFTRNSKDQATLRRYADMISSGSSEDLSLGQDCKNVKQRYQQVMKALGKD